MASNNEIVAGTHLFENKENNSSPLLTSFHSVGFDYFKEQMSGLFIGCDNLGFVGRKQHCSRQ